MNSTNTNTNTNRVKLTYPHIIGQGTYGCIYNPKLTCKNYEIPEHEEDNGNTKKHKSTYITKVHESDEENILNELSNAKKIVAYPNYEYYFAPLVPDKSNKMCEIAETEALQECNFIRKQSKTFSKLKTVSQSKTTIMENEWKISIIRYVGKLTLHKYLQILCNNTIFSKSRVYEQIQFITTYLQTSLAILYKIGIIHFDIKENNIIMDDNNAVPIIIDFGMSFRKDEIDKPFIFDSYPYWCIDIYILSYLQKYKTDTITDPTIIYNLYEKGLEDILLPDEIVEIKNRFVKKMNDIPTYDKLIATSNKWDMYSVSIILVKTLRKLGEYEDILKPHIQFIMDSIHPNN